MRVPAVLEKHSVPPLEFMARTGLSPNLFLQGARWLPRDYCFELVEKAVRLTGNPNFGAQVGAAIQLPDLGAYGQDILTAPSLGDALHIAQGRLAEVNRGSLLRPEKTPQSLILHFHFEGRLGVDPLQFDLGTIAVLRTIALLAGEPAGVRVELALSRSSPMGSLDEYLGEMIEFRRTSNAVIIDRNLLNLPLATSRTRHSIPDVAHIFETAKLVLKMLPEGRATLQDVAATLALNERTLQRRLAKFGVTFEQLVDTTRRDEAIRLVTLGTDSLADIALQIGYSEQANFNRAFRRWTGIPPTAYRQAAA